LSSYVAFGLSSQNQQRQQQNMPSVIHDRLTSDQVQVGHRDKLPKEAKLDAIHFLGALAGKTLDEPTRRKKTREIRCLKNKKCENERNGKL